MSSFMASGPIGLASWVCTTAALFLSAIGLWTCDFVQRQIILGVNAQKVYDTFCNLFSDADICGDQKAGIGFWASADSDGKCHAYKVTHSSKQGKISYEPSFDSTFKAARGMAMIATFVGLVLFIVLAYPQRYTFPPKSFKIISLVLFLTTILSAFTFLIFASDQCNTEHYDIVGVQNFELHYTCSPSLGSKCNVAATVLFFVAGSLCWVLGGRGDGYTAVASNGHAPV